MPNPRLLCLALLALTSLAFPRTTQAVMTGSSYVTTEPTSASVANWDTGWSSTDVTGWDYVGTVNGASGVYLGNGWVLTAAHVGAGAFVLNGTTYSLLEGPAITFGSADLILFQISGDPGLSTLTLASSAPIALSSQVVMIGYGGGAGETWGLNTVTSTNITNVPVTSGSSTYRSTLFKTAYGTHTYNGEVAITNNAQLVGGDSGGAGFIYNSSTQKWELAGIADAVNNGDSYLVQISAYAATINGIVAAVPEPGSLAMLGLGAIVVLGRQIRRRRPTV